MDKLLHFLIGLMLSANPLQEPDAALFTTVLAAAAKEFYDSKHKTKHTPDFKDFAATAAAGGMVWIYRTQW